MSSASSHINSASTPVVRAPTIVQQRIVLVVFLVAIGAVVWWQRVDRSADFAVKKFSRTLAPGVELDFASAEAAWSGLTIDPQGNLQVDALTETALSDAIVLMSDHSSQALTSRMALLLEKQFGAAASQQIMALLPILKSYKEIEQRWWAENGGTDPPPHAELFRLQDELLGKSLAEKMFSEQRRLAKTMLASQQIRNDPGLTQAEKDRALLQLQGSEQAEAARSD